MSRSRAAGEQWQRGAGPATHQQEREDDAPDKHPFGHLELDVDRAVVAALALDCVGPLLVSDTYQPPRSARTWSERIIVVAVKTSNP